MSTVTVRAGSVAAQVISQKIIDDGRELVPNGVDLVAPGQEVEFIINAGQSIRVVEAPAPAAEAAEVTA